MIPQASIIEWSRQAPWPTETQIEQDLILSRLIVEIANHPLLKHELAIRGGTCLHKLHLRQALRYSEDLDYVRRSRGPIKDVMEALRAVALDVGLTEHGYDQVGQMVHMEFDASPTSGMGHIRIKVEVNVGETERCEQHVAVHHTVDSQWWSGSAEVATFSVEELMGTKLRALYQRRKGRDLFDLWLALTILQADPDRTVACLQFYMRENAFRLLDLARNLADKLDNQEFQDDLDQLVIDLPAGYDMNSAADLIMENLGSRLEGAPSLERIQQRRWRVDE